MWHKVIFLVVGRAQIETPTWLFQKMLGPFGIPQIGTPQTPSYKLSLEKRVLLEGTPPWDQAILTQ